MDVHSPGMLVALKGISICHCMIERGMARRKENYIDYFMYEYDCMPRSVLSKYA